MIELVRWPGDPDRRAHLRAAGTPCLLVVEGGVAPPVCAEMEDWVRPPISRIDLTARREALSARVRSRTTVRIESGALCHLGARVAVSPAEVAVLAPLAEQFGEIVERDELMRRAWPDTTPGRGALDLRVLRLRKRLAPVGLTIQTARSRGHLMTYSENG